MSQLGFRRSSVGSGRRGFWMSGNQPWNRNLTDSFRAVNSCKIQRRVDDRQRKAFQAASVNVGLGVKTGPEVWKYKGLLIHDFRRSGVRILIRSGVPRNIATKISGHLKESTFERYDIVDSTDLNEVVVKVEEPLMGQWEINENSSSPARNEPASLLFSIVRRGSSAGRAADS
jgi:hypothetical protein